MFSPKGMLKVNPPFEPTPSLSDSANASARRSTVVAVELRPTGQIANGAT